MIYFSIVFLCTGGLFLALLEDRFRFLTTLILMAGAYFLALGAAFLLRRTVDDPVLAQQLPCAAGCLIFFLVSLFAFTNNPLQKAFVALLSLCDFTFLSFFIPLLLGTVFSAPSGGSAGFLSVLACCLFTLLIGLCLYRPFRHYSDRGISGFLMGMFLAVLFLQFLCLGRFDFLFRTNIPAARLLLATVLYCAVIFAFRSLYQAGRFRAEAAAEASRKRLLALRENDCEDALTVMREVQAAEKSGGYALDTVSVLLADGYSDRIPEYIASIRKNAAENPMLAHYHDDPRINAVIAAKAAFAARNEIAFECNAVTDQVPLDPMELCVIIDEMLSRACRDAAACSGDRRVRFTAFPAERSLRFEAVYSGSLPGRRRISVRGKSFSEVLSLLLNDPADGDELYGLECTADLLSRYGGKMTVSGARGEVILQARIRF